MSNLQSIIKYDMGSTTSVAGQQPYKNTTSIGPIVTWSEKEKLNGLREYTIVVPNDEFHRANLLIERNVTVPFITPMNGIIVQKKIHQVLGVRRVHLMRIVKLCFMMEINKYLLTLSIFFILSLIYQIKVFRVNSAKSCLFSFNMNNLTGLLIFLFIFSFNF